MSHEEEYLSLTLLDSFRKSLLLKEKKDGILILYRKEVRRKKKLARLKDGPAQEP